MFKSYELCQQQTKPNDKNVKEQIAKQQRGKNSHSFTAFYNNKKKMQQICLVDNNYDIYCFKSYL